MSESEVREAALSRLRNYADAAADLDDAVREARRLGIPIRQIASAAEIARTRVYRILNREESK